MRPSGTILFRKHGNGTCPATYLPFLPSWRIFHNSYQLIYLTLVPVEDLMRLQWHSLLIIALIVAGILFAGCSTQKTDQTSSGTASSGSGAAQAAPSDAAAACPTMNGKGAWDSAWQTHIETRYTDARKAFYPATADVPDAWVRSDLNTPMPMTFTQNGCDVSGTLTTSDNCPVSFTGKVSGTNLKGTWKAYCKMNVVTAGSDESGTFDIWMEPGGTTFAGVFDGSSAASLQQTADALASGQNGNFVGKRG
jgi:predicted small secreted protein